MASGLSQQGHEVAAEQGSYGMLSGDSAFHEDELEEAAVPAQEPSAAHHGQKEGSLRAHMGQAEPDLAEGGSPSAEIRTVHHTQKNGSIYSHTAQRDADPAGGVKAAEKAPQAQHSQKEVAAERAHMPQLELDAIGLYTPLERAKQADAAGQAAALKGAASASHTHALEAAGQETPLEIAERAAHTHEEGAHHVQKGAQPHGAPAKASESRAHVVIDEHAHHKQADGQHGAQERKAARPSSNHGKAEAIYWEGRERAEAARLSLPAEVFQRQYSNLSEGISVWDLYPPDYNCPLLKERVGPVGRGGKWICGMRTLQEMHHCLVYSLGGREDTGVEDELADRTLCEVHRFDPVPSAEPEAHALGRPGLHFHSVGISGGPGGQAGRESAERWQSLEGIMLELGHEWLEVLSVESRGQEWALFRDFYQKPGATLPATNLVVRFHMAGDVAEACQVIDLILSDSFRVFSAQPRGNITELAFVKVSPDGLVCIPHGHSAAQDSSLAQLPMGCLNPPRKGIITN
ncbi:hypothetical protein CVIRNUC_007073 [Coccomyxa viridis]|uniref:Methyltransferase domain-containing protein n=1 Tax=Coccomyxa viridis TaxID=1274662 RepID=A0AAV1I920_9CHLO|nr:hypothetical protein CVIRNUC_007073 [Coccomyxa viridis]